MAAVPPSFPQISFPDSEGETTLFCQRRTNFFPGERFSIVSLFFIFGVLGMLEKTCQSDGDRHPRTVKATAHAVRLVRTRADEWAVEPKRIGIMGSSAGGHLASTLLTHFDAGGPAATDPIERQSSRPDLGILCYPVISMGPNTHVGSKNNLLGKDPDPQLVQLLSNELQVTKDTPPCFLWHTWEDKAVK